MKHININIDDIIQLVKDELGENVTVVFEEVKKNNGVMAPGVKISDGFMATPVVYIDPNSDESANAKRIIRDYKHWLTLKDDVKNTISELSNKETLLKSAVPCLVNREKNEDLLKTIPHLPFLDLEVVFRFFSSDGSTTLITNDLLKSVKSSAEELEKAAATNLSKISPDIKPFPNIDDELAISVITSELNVFSTGMILRRDVLENVRSLFHGDLYLIPSSIHEFLAVKITRDDALLDVLHETVRDINNNPDTISDRDVLSDTIYMYDGKEVSIARR